MTNDYNETPRIESMYVSKVVDVPFAEAAETLTLLAGQSIEAGTTRLETTEPDALVPVTPYRRMAAELRIRGLLPRTMHVDLVLTPWSEERTEIGMTPRSRHLSLLTSSSERYLRSAREATDAVAARVSDPVWAQRRSA